MIICTCFWLGVQRCSGLMYLVQVIELELSELLVTSALCASVLPVSKVVRTNSAITWKSLLRMLALLL